MAQFNNCPADPKNWWFGHLHETATRGAGGQTCDALLEAVFGVTEQENSRFWQETVMLENKYGFWPQIHLGLPEGHVVSII